MNNIIMNQFKTNNINKTITTFYPGDTIEVKIWITESAKRRLQAFEGVVIAIRRSHSCCFSFTVRKISHGEGVERIFQINSPAIDSIIVKRRSDVRKAKLYYLRNRVGKSARIKEKLN